MTDGPPNAPSVDPQQTPQDAAVDTEDAPRSRRGLVLGAIVAVVLVVLGGTIAAAWNLLAGTDDVLAAHVPADAAAYVHVNLDPTAENKLGLRSLLGRLDAATDEDLSVDALVAQFQQGITDLGVEGIDAQETWEALGSQAAMWVGGDVFDAAMAGSEPSTVGLLVTLDDATTISELLDAEATGDWRDEGGTAGWQLDGTAVAAINDDILHIGTQDAVSASLAAVDPLADDADYQALNDEVPSGVLSVWFDVDGLMDQEEFAALRSFDVPTQAAMTLSFANGQMSFSTAQRGNEGLPEAVGVVRLEDLPGGGLAYLRMPQLGAGLATLEEALQAASELEGEAMDFAEVDEVLASVGTSTDDISGWLGDLALVVGYDPTKVEDNAFMQLHVGTADDQATQDLLDQALAEFASDPNSGLVIEDGRLVAGDLRVEVSDGRLQVAAGNGTGVLGDNDRYAAAVDGLDGDPSMFIDLRAIAHAAAEFVPDDALADLQVLGAFDAVTATQGDPRAAIVRGDLVITWHSDWTKLEPSGLEPALPDIMVGTTALGDLMGGGLDVPGPDLGPDPIPSGNTFGDDPALDALWNQCADGSMPACDQLWYRSGIGSGYEDFAETCGGTGVRETTCELDHGTGAATPTEPSPGPTGSATPVDLPPPGTDADLDILWLACAQGDMQACEDLFWQSPVNSDYEAFGRTCGDRVDDGFANCVSLFPEN